ncbi:MAG: amidohydrolase family protein [Candidatus Obscuribacterales bacterium]|nr:amidohydrolase family protein [Candidatus Obscuribacterales bacterium]
MKVDLSETILIDNHAHSLLKGFLDVDVLQFRRSFSESQSMSYIERHAHHSLTYINMLHRLRKLLPFETEDELIELRQKMSPSDYLNTLFDDASIGALLVDNGFMSDVMLANNELAKMSERPVYKIMRLEAMFERLIRQRMSFSKLERGIQEEILEASSDLVGLKTIAAYRGGLPTDCAVERSLAETEYKEICGSLSDIAHFRIEKSALYHYLLFHAFEASIQAGLPIQIHSGFGDTDLMLDQANPVLLTSVLKSKRFNGARFVFLHCFPYHKEAAYLCSVFPNCYMDLSLTVVLASATAKQVMLESMAVAPTTKILGGTDGHSVPEMHWYGALVTKEALQAVLGQLVGDNFIRSVDAMSIAEKFLYGNTRDLYNLEGLG